MMNKKAIATPSRTNEILKKYNLSAKKSLGQNFIIDPNILDNMVKIAGIDHDTNVIEVGPGIGALTEALAQSARQVLSFEIDQRFIPVLENELGHYDNLKIVHADALSVDLKKYVEEYFDSALPLALAANLPYYITTPILMHFLESDLDLESMTVMIQKEVAERLSARPGTKAYGSLSIAVQYYMQVEIAAIVPPTVFNPAPNIDSAIIHMSKYQEKPVEVEDEALFFRVVRQSFVQRRKTLRNNLIVGLGKEEAVKEKIDRAIESAGLDPKVRGESLSITEFAKLAEELQAAGVTITDFA